MAFESLSEKLQNTFKKLKGKGVLTESDINDAMREVKLALLEADVNFKVVKEFVADVKEKCMGQDVLASLTPGQQVIKVVNDQLTELILKSGATGIVMVHNHPNQPSSPSKSDTTLTGQCQWLCGFHNILFCDHVICGNDGIFSYYQSGMLREFSERLSVEKAVTEVVYGKE